MCIRDRHPGVTFRILESTNKQLRTRLVEGDIDLSIGHYREVQMCIRDSSGTTFLYEARSSSKPYNRAHSW